MVIDLFNLNITHPEKYEISQNKCCIDHKTTEHLVKKRNEYGFAAILGPQSLLMSTQMNFLVYASKNYFQVRKFEENPLH